METLFEYKEKPDNRVCMLYIADRLLELSKIKSNEKLRDRLDDFRTECVYNLGINALHNYTN